MDIQTFADGKLNDATTVENANADNALHAYLIKIVHKTSELVQSHAVTNR